MLFNSVRFFVFFALVWCVYWLMWRRVRMQNGFLLAASYVFYGFWDPRFLSLILLSTVVDFYLGQRLAAASRPSQRKTLVGISVAVNLGILGFFKYAGFFQESLVECLQFLGLSVSPTTLTFVLPVGISFYTFQTMSYTIDVYRGRLAPCDNFVDFAAFVAFFPQLVAGPIERAANLLPQFNRRRTLTASQVHTAFYLILWGLFKKVVVADNAGRIADALLDPAAARAGLDLWIGIVAFSFQIYGDFSGYSNMARGFARLLGFELMVNFRIPYASQTPSDFWQRWHISLSSWLRDYLYIPLGGNRGTSAQTYRNLLLTMLLGGLWHGAAWHFVLWGAYHGFILCVYRFVETRWIGSPKNSVTAGRGAAWIPYIRWALMTLLTQFGWLLFRVENTAHLFQIVPRLHVSASVDTLNWAGQLACWITPLVVAEIYQFRRKDMLAVTHWAYLPRVVFYAATCIAIAIYGVRESLEFIYFVF